MMDFIRDYTASKPFYEKNINVSFPNKLGNFELINIMAYERQSPGSGVSLGYNYHKSNIVISVYNKSAASIENCLESDMFLKEMEYCIEETYQMANSGGCSNINVHSPNNITFDVGESKYSFRYAIANYVSVSEEMVSLILLCVYRNHLIKIRYTTGKSIFIDTPDGENLFNGFMSSLCEILCP